MPWGEAMMLSREEFVAEVFRIAREMSTESSWDEHIVGVETHHIRLKHKKTLTVEKLSRMWPDLLKSRITPSYARSIIGAATGHQTSINTPRLEIVRRISSGEQRSRPTDQVCDFSDVLPLLDPNT
jgi:hypothetical protein